MPDCETDLNNSMYSPYLLFWTKSPLGFILVYYYLLCFTFMSLLHAAVERQTVLVVFIFSAITMKSSVNSLIRQSSQILRAKKGTDGNSLRPSLITHSRYFSFFRSSVLTGRSDEPLNATQETLFTYMHGMQINNSMYLWPFPLGRFQHDAYILLT